MTPPPKSPKIYHITHLDNLAAIVGEGSLVCDREILSRGGPAQVIGMSAIKRRRIEEIDVTCHPGTRVGDYVPFYFCPRSVMLYVIYCANHPQLTYRGGQGPIVHLEADLHATIQWADANGILWAFSLSNAGAYYTEFRSGVGDLNQLDWVAVGAGDFRNPDVKERKQAEFLMFGSFPFTLVERVGVRSAGVHAQVSEVLEQSAHRPMIEVRPDWYF